MRDCTQSTRRRSVAIAVAWAALVACSDHAGGTRGDAATHTAKADAGGAHPSTHDAAPSDAQAATPAAMRDAARGAEDAASSDAHAIADAGQDQAAPADEPFGIASSASSSRELDTWLPTIASAGFSWLRGFDTAQVDARLTTAEQNGVKVSGILEWSTASPISFPIDDLPGWSNYVSMLVTQCKGRVSHWEVWNEPPNFTENKMPEAYAMIVASAYEAAKKVDAAVQLGLAAQSVNVYWLEQSISAGAVDHFDYVTVHPYETLGLVAAGWEGEFMSIVPTLRKMLAAQNPAKADVPIWFTELGEPVQDAITPEHQADTLIKAYTLAIAQGVTRVHWFEGKDGDSGPFGLLDADLMPRASFTAASALIAQLGAHPRYLGWLLLNDTHYAFVFEGEKAEVMVAWAQPGASDAVDFGKELSVIVPATGNSMSASSYDLSASPIIVSPVPPAWLAQARDNRLRPFPWGGDYTDAAEVSIDAPDSARGLHWIGTPASITIDGQAARDCSGAPAQSFTVDPNFLSYTSTPIQITAVLRRNGAASAGFNLKYESTSDWQGTGSWYDVPGSDQWYTQTWTIDDSQFVGKWGFNFSFDSDSTDHSQYSVQRVSVKKL